MQARQRGAGSREKGEKGKGRKEEGEENQKAKIETDPRPLMPVAQL